MPWDGDPNCFALRVRGDSMTGAAILDGDLVVVRPQQSADDGQIVVALLGDEATVILLSNGRIVEEGTHEQLLARKGKYANMYTIQASYYQEGDRGA